MKVSIVIPVYKTERYLRECLDSVLAQTYADWEAICIDDGSPDGSGAILEEYARHDSRFVVIHQENRGPSGARNAGLEIARGSWVTFLDSDDLILPHWIEEAMALAKMGNFDLIRMRTGGAEDGRGRCFAREGREASIWCWNTLLNVGYACICFYRREVIGHWRFRNVCKEDGIFHLDVSSDVRSICQGEYAGYFYRPTEGSLTKSSRRVARTVGYLTAYADIWQSKKEWARTLGIENVVRSWLRQGADFEVWEWSQKRDVSEGNGSEIRKAYRHLEAIGALAPGHELIMKRLLIPLEIWRKTGSLIGFRLLNGMMNMRRRLLP